MKKDRKKIHLLYYLNPKNVSAAIATYGYTYKISNTILAYLAVIGLSVVMGYLFKLGIFATAVIAAAGMITIPRIIINSYRNMYEQKRFSDVNLYIEQILYSFKKKPIILNALQDVERIIPEDSPMRKILQEAIDYIIYGYSEGDLLETALQKIEKKYKCQRIRDAHALMLKTTKIGGDYKTSIKILLSSRAVWETQTCKFQKECKKRQMMVNIALVIICAICLITPLMISGKMEQINILGSPIYRIGTAVMIVLFMRTYLKANRLTTINWLKNETETSEEEQLRLYEKVMTYDFAEQKKKSYLWALIPVNLAILFFFLKWKYPLMACVPLLIFMLNQHKVSYNMAKKKCIREINIAFPQWLMEVSLLLQTTNNVNKAVELSINTAPIIMVPELQKMRDAFMINPESNVAYMDFMRSFKIPEIQSAMGMLYSVSTGRGGDTQAQIDEILEKNAILLSQSEEIESESRLAALYWQFLFPSIIGAGKLLIDMTLILLGFLQIKY